MQWVHMSAYARTISPEERLLLRTRGIVASAGTFGYELDLMKMSEEEKKTAREQILKYKEMEHLVQSGGLLSSGEPIRKPTTMYFGSLYLRIRKRLLYAE